MIITKAPLRISFIGGGSDYPAHFLEHQGAVLGTTIDQFVYVTLNELSKFADEKFRFTYRQTESVDAPIEFTHPVMSSVITHYFSNQNPRGLNIGTMSDIPGKTGLGSSSSFTVALLLAIENFKVDGKTEPADIAREAVRVERQLLGEPGGWQDQYHASFGGLRLYQFSDSGVNVGGPLLNSDQLLELSEYFVLVKTGLTRDSGQYAKFTQSSIMTQKLTDEINKQKEKAIELAAKIPGKPIEEIADLLFSAIEISNNWKNGLGKDIYPQDVLELGKKGMHLGANCFKLLGAGGSGYILFGGSRDAISKIRENLEDYHLDVKFIYSGAESFVI